MKYNNETRGCISVALKEADNNLNNARTIKDITCSLTRVAEILVLLNDYKKLGWEIMDYTSSGQSANMAEYAKQIHLRLTKDITKLNFSVS